MHKTLLIIRVLFIAFCAIASWLIYYTVEEWDHRRGLAVGIGLMLGGVSHPRGSPAEGILGPRSDGGHFRLRYGRPRGLFGCEFAAA